MNKDPFVLHGKKCDIINTLLLYCYYTEASQSKLLKYYPENIDFVLSSFFSTYFHRCMNQKRIIFNSIYIYLYRAFHNKHSKVVFLLTYNRTKNLQRSVDVFRILYCPGFIFLCSLETSGGLIKLACILIIWKLQWLCPVFFFFWIF